MSTGVMLEKVTKEKKTELYNYYTTNLNHPVNVFTAANAFAVLLTICVLYMRLLS